jgi:hypothetical protein
MPQKPLSADEMLEALRVVSEYGSITEAARRLGLNRETLQSRVNRARTEMAKGTLDPDLATRVPEGHKVRGVSTLYNQDGEIKAQWVKTDIDPHHVAEAREAAIQALAADIPRVSPLPAPTQSLADLLALYTLTDGHVGMLAWHREGGQDWDLQIAEDVIVGCFAETIRQMPHASQAILNQLGDLLHYDSLNAVTPTSGHILDADGRFTKMVESAVRILRRVIDMLLAKHERVHIIMAEGNHDMASSVWLRTMFKALYENEPRITVDDSALPYYAYQWGEVMLGFHHSHLKRNFGDLRAHMAAQFSQMWGATRKRYCHTGDKHHASEKDEMGMHIIQHPTLAARDAYAARGGWHSERNMSGICYHKKYGQVGRVTVCPEMLGG